MDQIKESEDSHSWTPESLRKCHSLTLASDVALLKCMQTLSMRMVSRANNLLKDLDSLNEDTTSACVEVEYCIQNLNLISTKQFMEKRVYDEEVSEKKEESTTQIQPVITSIDFVPKIKEAIREGLPAVKLKIANFEEKINGNFSQSQNKNTNSHYSRSLPYLLGTEEFIDSPTVGVAEGHKFKSESATHFQLLPSQTSNSTLSSVHSSPSLKSNLQVPIPVDNRMHSDSDVSSMSEAGGGIFFESKEIDEAIKRPGLGSLQEALSARLKNTENSNVKTSSEAYTTPCSKVPVKNEAQCQEIENRIPSPFTAASQPKVEIVPSREIIKPPKKRNLFDDSSSESEGELFRSNVSKVPAPPSNLFNPPVSKPAPSTSQLIVAKNTPTFAKTKSNNLFGSSDSEDDLFSGITSNEPSSKRVVKSMVGIVTNVSDGEENVFSPNISNLPSAVVVAPTKSESLFGDEDVTDCVAKKYSVPNPVAVPKLHDKQPILQTKQPIFEEPKQRNIFADSDDSDEDLFRNVIPTKNKTPGLVVPPSTLSSSPLPDKLVAQSSRHQSTPIQNGQRKEEEEEQKHPASTTANNNKPIHVEQLSNVKAKSSVLFGDDSDDEDLFKGVTVPKTPSTKDLLQNKGLLQNVHKDSKGADVSADGVPPQTPIGVAKAMVESSDDLFSGVLPTKQPSLSETPSIARKLENSVDESPFRVAQATEKPTLSPRKGSADPETMKIPDDEHILATASITASSKSAMLTVNISDNLVGRKSPQPAILPQIPVLKAFEESDDEDLFGIKVDKRPSNCSGQTVPVKIATTTTTGDIQRTIKDEDILFKAKKQKNPLPQLPVISQQKAWEKSENERVSSRSPETEVEPQASSETGDNKVSRIASLKLSLAKQPNSLPFSNPGSTTSTPNDEEDSISTSNSNVRKPFGGVPLFGPRISSPVKSNLPSPTKSEQNIMSRESQLENSEEVTHTNDLLNCVSKQRPKAPSRRLPSRNFRRSQIEDDKDDDSIVAKAEGTHQSPQKMASVPKVVDPVVTPPLKPPSPVVDVESKPANRSLFDDSDSSDGELFKTGAVSKTKAPLRKGGLKSNVKINSSLIGSGSDESFISNQSTIQTPKKVTTPSFLLVGSDDDDDLFASIPKLRDRPKPDPTLVVNKGAPAASDPLLHFQP